jgi:hypothetical protein
MVALGSIAWALDSLLFDCMCACCICRAPATTGEAANGLDISHEQTVHTLMRYKARRLAGACQTA